MTLFSKIYLICSIFAFSSLDATVVRLTILEQMKAQRPVRTVIFHDAHWLYPTMESKQASSIASAFYKSKKLGSAKIIIEAEPQKHTALIEIADNIYYKQAFYFMETYESDPVFRKKFHEQKSVYEVLCQKYSQGIVGNKAVANLLQKELMQDETNAVDNRTALINLMDLIGLTARQTDFIGTSFLDRVKELNDTLPLTAKEFLTLIEDFFVSVEKALQNTTKNAPFLQNNRVLQNFAAKVHESKESIKELRKAFKKHLSKKLLTAIYQTGLYNKETIAFGLAVIHSFSWVAAYDKTNSDLALEIFMMDDLLRQPIPDTTYIVAGAAHGENLIDFLKQAGASVLFDSKIKLNNGIHIDKVDAWLQGHPHLSPIPLAKDAYELIALNRSQLMALQQLRHDEL